MRRALLVIAAAVTVAACSSSGPSVGFKPKSKEYFSERQYGRAVRASPIRARSARAAGASS